MSNELVVLRDEIAESGFVTARVFLNPLPGIEPIRVKARIGSLVKDILPKEARAPMVCLIDGVPMKREWWMQRPVCEGDNIEFHPIVLGGKGGVSARVLAIIAAIALSYFAPIWVGQLGAAFPGLGLVGANGALTWLGHLAVAGIVLVGNALISAVIPQSSGGRYDPDKASSIYSVDTQGNSAKLFSPIPVQYGRMKYYPNYAAQPYSIYHTPDTMGESSRIILKIGQSGGSSGGSSQSGSYHIVSENGYTYVGGGNGEPVLCKAPNGSMELIYSDEEVRAGMCPCYKWYVDSPGSSATVPNDYETVPDIQKSLNRDGPWYITREDGKIWVSYWNVGEVPIIDAGTPTYHHTDGRTYIPYEQSSGGGNGSYGSDSYGASENGDLYYYALFCLGQGEYDIEQICIADAPLWNKDSDTCAFNDVIVADILPPGVKPKVVNPCVVTSEAVSGQSLDKGEWVGPFPICGPERKAKHIELDFVFPQGLCKLNDKGKAESATVRIEAQGRAIGNNGEPQSGWFGMGDIQYTQSSLTPQRRTFPVDLNIEGVPTAFRIEVRVKRVGTKDPEDTKDMTSVQWAGMKAYLEEDAPLCETATHFELVMRASEQLSSLSQRKISILATRKIPTWDSDVPVATRSPAHALYDKWTNTVYGDGLPIDRIDLDMLRHYHSVSQERGDLFDYVFENRSTSQEADQLIAKVMRCVALQRQGVKTIVRDELCEMPLTLFNPTNIVEKSVSLDYVQITEETTDGVIVEYFSSVSWDWEEVECPGPGRTYSNTSHDYYNPALPVMENPARVTLQGITTREHAEREGLYLAYTNAMRRQFVTWTTELQGALVYYGAPVLLATTLYNMQQGGEIRDYDENTNTFELTNGVTHGKIVMMKKDGSLSEPLDFTIVDEDKNKIRINGSLNFSVNYGDYASERTKYVILEGEMIRRIVKILSVTPKGVGDSGAPLYELKGVVDVPEVHLIDQCVKPRPPDVPPYNPSDDPDIPVVPVTPTDNYRIKLGEIATVPFLMTYQALYPNTGYPASIQFYRDGALRTHYFDRNADANPVTRGAIPGQEKSWNHWVDGAPIQNVGSLYEIMFVVKYSNVNMLQAAAGNVTSPDAAYLAGPRRDILDGYKVTFSGLVDRMYINSLENSTADVISFANNYRDWATDDDIAGQTFLYTDWISLDTDPELKGFWDTKPYPYPTSVSIFGGNARKSVYVGIRDKARRTVQAKRHYMLGIYRQYNDVP